MASRRYRRRYRFGRRRRRRLYRSKMFRRRRRYRRRGRRSVTRGSTVSFTTDYVVDQSSYIKPVQYSDTNAAGVSPDSYPAWSINVLPNKLALLPGPNYLYRPDAGTGSGSSAIAQTFATANWSNVLGSTTYLNSQFKHNPTYIPDAAMRSQQVDFPMYTNLRSFVNFYDMERLAAIYDRVRVNRITVTLTVPENTSTEKNHHLYIMYNYGRGFESATAHDLVHYVFNSTAQPSEWVDTNIRLPQCVGFNWLWKQEDVVNAGSLNGVRNAKSGWHIRELAYNKPVTLSWVPRHARIATARNATIDATGAASTNDLSSLPPHVINYEMNFSNSHRLSSASVECNARKLHEDNIWYTGPLVRLLDADKAPASAFTPDGSSLFDKYGIRAHLYCSFTFTHFNQVDPLVNN